VSRALSTSFDWTRWAWCSSRSTVAVARVLGMIVSKSCPQLCPLRDLNPMPSRAVTSLLSLTHAYGSLGIADRPPQLAGGAMPNGMIGARSCRFEEERHGRLSLAVIAG
jgi:hypothetical protein